MHRRKTYMYNNFQQNRVSGSVKTVYINLFSKLQLELEFKKKSRLSNMHCPLTDSQADFEINRPVRYRNTAKKLFPQTTDGQTARQTDGQTDGQTDKHRE